MILSCRDDQEEVPRSQKYRVIDPGFVRFRTKAITSENMNAQLRIVAEILVFQIYLVFLSHLEAFWTKSGGTLDPTTIYA